MAKTKNQIVENKKNNTYLSNALCIAIAIFCVLLIGRVGSAGTKIFLFVNFLLGDFSTLILAIVLVYSVLYVLFKKKCDFHHISFIGSVFIYIAFSMFAHMGLYEALSMTDKTILSKTLSLYKNYMIHYEDSYSCGGGVIAAIFVQISSFLLGKMGTILLGICFILIGLSFFANMNILKFFKGGKLSKIPKNIIRGVLDYVNNIHYPSGTKVVNHKKISLSMLSDHDEQVSFTLQSQINKEKFDDFKRFIRDNKIYCVTDTFYTSYSSSRFVLKMANKNDDAFRMMSSFFNNNCFYIKRDNEYYLEIPNQFRKLLTLKSLLLSVEKDKLLPLACDVDSNIINLDMTKGRMIVLVGDETSGLKTMIRSILVSILIKGLPYSDIYFYDLYNDFSVLNNSSIKYINNERSASIALDEAFSEYERRSEILKYLDCDSIDEANKIIKNNHSEIGLILPIYHFILMDLTKINTSLLQKISYAIRFTLKVGINLVFCTRSRNELSKLELNNSDIICLYTSDVTTSLKLFGSDMASRLQKKGDVIISSDGRVYHGQAPYISIEDFNTILKKI